MDFYLPVKPLHIQYISYPRKIKSQIGLESFTGHQYFSIGNLQFNAVPGLWRFAENQWEHIGDANANISSSYDGWIDLFGWGISNHDHGAVCYQPRSTSTNTSDYCAYGSPDANLYDNDGTADWGVNDIENGSLSGTVSWRTLTYDEWEYLLNGRPDAESKHGHGTVCGHPGMLFLPDDFTLPEGCSFVAGTGYETNVYYESTWSEMEQAGVLFLPTTGIRIQAMVGFDNTDGGYWSSSSIGSDNAFYLSICQCNIHRWQRRRNVWGMCPVGQRLPMTTIHYCENVVF
jgi:hypothetical protein